MLFKKFEIFCIIFFSDNELKAIKTHRLLSHSYNPKLQWRLLRNPFTTQPHTFQCAPRTSGLSLERVGATTRR